jgi:riboflavin transport system permease protein
MTGKRRMNELMVNATGLAVILAVAVTIAVILFILLSSDPGRTIYYFFVGPFTTRFYFGNLLNSAIPLLFTGLGVAMAFKSSVFNIGGEGQIYAGAVMTTVVCLALPNLPGLAGGFLAVVVGLISGALLAGISGYLRMKWDIDVLISSFLISGAAVLILNYFITGPLDDPESSLLATRKIADQYRLLQIFRPSKLDISIVFALLAAGLVFVFMRFTHWGYEMRMCGANPEFARYGGVNVSTYLVVPMMISGALHGMGGSFVVMGTHHMALKEFTSGMGWNGIAVALIAKNHPLGVIPAALFFAYLDAGAKAAMLHSDVTFEIAAVIQSVIFYLVTAQALYAFVSNRRKGVV